MRFVTIVAVIAVAVIAQGCGGSGSSTSSATPSPSPSPSVSPSPSPLPSPSPSASPSSSPFTGYFVGTFATTNPQSGTLNVTVGTDGALTGAGHNNTINQDETISGTVSNTGAVNITFKYPTFSASASGTVAFKSNGHLGGTLIQSSGDTVTIDLVKQ